MLITTTHTVQGRDVEEYLDIVTGEAIMAANIVRDFMAGVRDIIGGRSGAYENKLAEGRDIAISEMKEKATQIGANAIIGIHLDYETVGNGMLMVVASGTAVRIR
ncbi:YbjQ family protein [Brevibacillus laterosporus]|uniref:YbjQ family protein n=1 Tax=Brevibacillus laterosporus TaxID=1465 RepID=UPI003D2409B5